MYSILKRIGVNIAMKGCIGS